MAVMFTTISHPPVKWTECSALVKVLNTPMLSGRSVYQLNVEQNVFSDQDSVQQRGVLIRWVDGRRDVVMVTEDTQHMINVLKLLIAEVEGR